MGAATAPVQLTRRLEPAELAAVRRLIDAATEVDGVPPLSEHVSLHLRYGGDAETRNALVRAPDGSIAGYAHLDVTDEVAGASAELVVHPQQRRRGYGRALVERLLAQAPEGRLRLWAHGEHSDAAKLAAALGFTRVRALLQLRRSLYVPLPPANVPAGTSVRTFDPDRDAADWVALNAAAFGEHPEQGQWTLKDLQRRMQEPWFDPAGFFLAERSGRLVGFHWTKVHGGARPSESAGRGDGHGHDPLGEVYVVGVHPQARGGGLGRALTVVGLAHLRNLGLPAVMLYVEQENTAAIRVYEGLDFTRWDTDVVYRSPARDRSATPSTSTVRDWAP